MNEQTPMIDTYEGAHPSKEVQETLKLHLSKDALLMGLLIASVALNLAQVATLLFLILKQ